MRRRRRVLVFAAGAAVVWGAGPLGFPGAAGAWAVAAAGGPAVPAASSWGKAIEVPGLAALNKADGQVDSVSCASAGNCAAGGIYAGGSGWQGFVAVERDGRWGKAIGVPGLAALNKGGTAQVYSVSCGAAGNCAAGGIYTDGDLHGFVAVERDGRWGKAIEVPGLAALNKGGEAAVNSVSCTSAGSCAAGGYYGDGSRDQQGFAVAERDGRWGKAIGVPGLAALNKGGEAAVNSVSCASAGRCAVVGYYADGKDNRQGFAAVERNGRWDKATGVPGLAALNNGGGAYPDAEADEVSCAPAGSCAAGGFYTDKSGNSQGFVAAERNGRWGKATGVPGLAALNKGGEAEVLSVSCASAGSCAAGGYYGDGFDQQGFVAAERNGRWGKATGVPGLGTLNKGGDARVFSVSCASAGNCAIGGYYADGPEPPRPPGHVQGFVATERNGHWGKATGVPGLRALNKTGEAYIYSVSCAPAGRCTAGGVYSDRSGLSQGFVTQAR
jgi:hypothetical protein